VVVIASSTQKNLVNKMTQNAKDAKRAQVKVARRARQKPSRQISYALPICVGLLFLTFVIAAAYRPGEVKTVTQPTSEDTSSKIFNADEWFNQPYEKYWTVYPDLTQQEPTELHQPQNPQESTAKASEVPNSLPPPGLIAGRISYRAFGQVRTLTGHLDTPFRFNGYIDDSNGELSSPARYYASALGRFTGMDPAAMDPMNPMTLNPYLGLNGNPLAYIDANGKVGILSEAEHFTDSTLASYTQQIEAAKRAGDTDRAFNLGLFKGLASVGNLVVGGLNTTSNLLVQSNYDDGETYQQAQRELMQNEQSMSQAIESSVNLAGRTGSDPVGTINGAGFALQDFSNRLDQRDPGAAASFGEYLGQSLVPMGGVEAGAARAGARAGTRAGTRVGARLTAQELHAVSLSGDMNRALETSYAEASGRAANRSSAPHRVQEGANGESELVPMSELPKVYQSPSTLVRSRVNDLGSQIPENSQGRITMGVAVVEDVNGVRTVLVSTSEPRGYLRPGVTVQTGEIVVPGTGHAEADIVAFAKKRQLKVIDIGATRRVCQLSKCNSADRCEYFDASEANSKEETMMMRLDTSAPELASRLRAIGSIEQRAAALFASDLALLTTVDSPIVASAVEDLKKNRLHTQTTSNRLNELVDKLDNEYFALQENASSGSSASIECLRKFSQARAVSALMFAGGEDPLCAAMDAIYEASMSVDDANAVYAVVFDSFFQ
jgi:RHS repeat-associated protein